MRVFAILLDQLYEDVLQFSHNRGRARYCAQRN